MQHGKKIHTRKQLHHTRVQISVSKNSALAPTGSQCPVLIGNICRLRADMANFYQLTRRINCIRQTMCHLGWLALSAETLPDRMKYCLQHDTWGADPVLGILLCCCMAREMDILTSVRFLIRNFDSSFLLILESDLWFFWTNYCVLLRPLYHYLI